MTVIATTDLSDYKNEKLSKSISLIEQFGVYGVIAVEYVPGWFGYGDIEVIDKFTKYRNAVKCYIEHGGQMRREF